MNKVNCWAAVETDGSEYFYSNKPIWQEEQKEWYLSNESDKYIEVPKGTIKRLTGITLRYDDEPILLK